MLKHTIIFVCGAAIGAVAAWHFTKGYYEKRCEEDVESVTRALTERYESKPKRELVVNVAPVDSKYVAEKIAYDCMVADRYGAKVIETEEDDKWLINGPNEEHPTDDEPSEPFVITPDEFVNEKREYEKITLNYYDGTNTLCSDNDQFIEDIDDCIGSESLQHFGEFEEDYVYVRNNRLGVDYEVYLMHGKYHPPYPMEGYD